MESFYQHEEEEKITSDDLARPNRGKLKTTYSYRRSRLSSNIPCISIVVIQGILLIALSLFVIYGFTQLSAIKKELLEVKSQWKKWSDINGIHKSLIGLDIALKFIKKPDEGSESDNESIKLMLQRFINASKTSPTYVVHLIRSITSSLFKLFETKYNSRSASDSKLLWESVYKLVQDIDDSRRESYFMVDSLNSSLLHLQQWVGSNVKSNQQQIIGFFNNSMLQLSNNVFDIKKDLENRIKFIKESLASFQNQLVEVKAFNIYLKDTVGPDIPTSCSSILQANKSSQSGYYWLKAANGSLVHVYCDMTRTCGNITGGWTRVFELDMTNTSTDCPVSLCLNSSSNLRTCRLCQYEGGCSSEFISAGISYSHVCGKINGYQLGSLDGIMLGLTPTIDGITLTRGLRREHVWTFSAISRDAVIEGKSYCPCLNQTTDTLLSYIGNDFFCAVGKLKNNSNDALDPMWEELGSEGHNKCCNYSNPPWFYKELPHITTEDIEIKICRDEDRNNEDFAIEVVEIYVQ